METNLTYNPVRQFLELRDYTFQALHASESMHSGAELLKATYIIDPKDTLDGLKLTIVVQTLVVNNRSVAQDFIIKDRRGNAPIHATANDVMDKLRMYL